MNKKWRIALIPVIVFAVVGGCGKPSTVPEAPTPTPINTPVTVENVLDGVFAEGLLNYVKLKIDSAGTLYVAYIDNSNNKLAVKRLTQAGTAWETLGVGPVVLGTAPQIDFELNESGVPYIVFTDNDYSNKATVMKYNNSGNSWEVVGTRGFTPGSAQLNSLAVTDDIPVIAFSDGSCDGKLTVMRYDAAGNSFTALAGGCMTPESLSYVALCIHDNKPIIAYRYQNDPATRTKKFNELQDIWVDLGLNFLTDYGRIIDMKIYNGEIFALHTSPDPDYGLKLKKYTEISQTWDEISYVQTLTQFYNGRNLVLFKNTQYASYIDEYNVGPQKPHILKYNQSKAKWEEIFVGLTWTYYLSIAGYGDYLYCAYRRSVPSQKGYIQRILQ